MFPSLDFAKIQLDYVKDLNKNNETRMNMYIQLNTATIAFMNVAYIKDIIKCRIVFFSSFLLMLSTMLFFVSLFWVVWNAISMKVNANSLMLTTRICTMGRTNEGNCDENCKPQTYIAKLRQEVTSQDSEVDSILTEVLALSEASEKRGGALETTRHFFIAGVAVYIVALGMSVVGY